MNETMPNAVVLDASAPLAVIHGEPGAQHVETHLPYAAISAANLAEVLSKLIDSGVPEEEASAAVADLGPTVVPLDGAQARAIARLRPMTRKLGLSLGDRACLVLVGQLGLPALTADRLWAKLHLGIEIRVIR